MTLHYYRVFVYIFFLSRRHTTNKCWPTCVCQQCWQTKVCRVFKKLANILCWPTMFAICELVHFLLANKRETVCCDWLAIVNMAASEWTDDAVAELIAMYEKYPCLYDTSTHDYRNKKQLQKSLLLKRRRRLLSRPSPPYCCPTFVGQHLFVVCPRL